MKRTPPANHCCFVGGVPHGFPEVGSGVKSALPQALRVARLFGFAGDRAITFSLCLGFIMTFKVLYFVCVPAGWIWFLINFWYTGNIWIGWVLFTYMIFFYWLSSFVLLYICFCILCWRLVVVVSGGGVPQVFFVVIVGRWICFVSRSECACMTRVWGAFIYFAK